MPQLDLFLQSYFARHIRPPQSVIRPPYWLSSLVAVCLSASTVAALGLGQAHIAILVWVLAAALAGATIISRTALLQAAVVTAAGALLWRWLEPQFALPSLPILGGYLLGVAVGSAVGLAVHVKQKLAVATTQAELLHQLYAVWAQSEGSCLKEIGLDGRLLSMSSKGLAVMEVCDFEQVRGSDWLKFWAGEWAEPARRAFAEATNGKLARFSGFCPTARGTPKWWDVTLMPVTNNAGTVESVLSLSWDVTAQKQREQQSADAAELTRSITDAIPFYLGVLDVEGKLCTSNKAWREFEDKNAPLWAGEGQDYLEVCRASARAGFAIADPLADGIEAILHNRGGQVFLHYQPVINGRDCYYRASAVPINSGNGKVLIIHEDLTEQMHMQQTLELQDQRLKLVHEGSNDGLWEWRPETRRVYVSERFVQLLGAAPADGADFPAWFRERVHPQDLPAVTETFTRHLQCERNFDVEMRLDTPGGWRWFRSRGKAEREDGRVLRLAGSLMDVTLQRELLAQVQTSEARFRDMVEHLPHIFWEFDVASSKLTYLSPAFERTFGISPVTIYGRPCSWYKLVHPEDSEAAKRFRTQAFIEHRPTEAEFRARSNSGQDVWIRVRAFPFTDPDGTLKRMVGIAENISEARVYQQRLYAADHFDKVCGLPNRLLFTERLDFQCKHPEQNQHPFVVMVIAVNRLKWVDQSLGQSAKDDLIRQVASRFAHALAERGYLASLGGGEFAVLLSRDPDLNQFERVAHDLQTALEAHFIWGEDSVALSARIGAAQYPADGDSADTLLKHANVALYSLQQAGRCGFAIFKADLLQTNIDSLRLETDLARAQEQQEFVLYYQPKFCLREQRVCGAEALIRWQHPEHGLVGPLRFIHLLESTDLILPVGRWCINQALAQLACWHKQGLSGFVMAVNVSLKQLGPALVEHVRAALALHNVAPQWLELELTESIMHEPGDATAVVDELRALGVRIAVDDFGTGYSTLGSLKSFVPDTLKIDKQFLNEMEHDAADQAIVRGVIDMAHALKMRVVAEGVECAEQKLMLEQLNCDQIQGYLLSPPIAAEAFAQQFLQRLDEIPAAKGRRASASARAGRQQAN